MKIKDGINASGHLNYLEREKTMNRQAKIRARSVPGTPKNPEAFVIDIQAPQFQVFSSRMNKETAQKIISAFQLIYSLEHPLESIHKFVEVCTKNLIEFQYTLDPVESGEPWAFVPYGGVTVIPDPMGLFECPYCHTEIDTSGGFATCGGCGIDWRDHLEVGE